MKRVLFVCTGNTCRSSMAEAIANNMLYERGLEDKIQFESAGIYAYTGDRASLKAIETMEDMGIDIKGHIARRITREIIEESDIILTMTNQQKLMINSIAGEFPGKVYTLREFSSGENEDIPDPYGCSLSVYRECALCLKKYISMAIDRILNERQ